MSRVTKSRLLAALGLAGLAATPVYAPAGIALTVVATVMATFSVMGLNAPATRLPQHVAVLSQAAALYLATRDPMLSLAALVSGSVMVPTELLLLHSGRAFAYIPLVGGLLSCALVAFAWPVGLWGLAVVPMIFMNLFFGPRVLAGRNRNAARAAKMELHVGEPLPELKLPYRDGSGEVDFTAERDHPVLLLFVRGDWCAICHVLMRVVSRERRTLQDKGVKLYLVTPAEGEVDAELAEQLGLDTRMLLDRGAEAARRFGMLEAEGPNGPTTLPIAILVDAQGVIRDITKPEDVTAYANESRIAKQLQLLPAAA